MSLFFCGIILSHYNSYNLSVTSQITAHNIFKSLAGLCEFFVFLYIGMGIFTGAFKHINFTFCFAALAFCLIARVGNIFPISYLANLGRQQKIPIKMQVVMWFAGLRGAIAFALVSFLLLFIVVSTHKLLLPSFSALVTKHAPRTSRSVCFHNINDRHLHNHNLRRTH
jgi:NhaP-type Na+/H+ or K+/H+ antiporter